MTRKITWPEERDEELRTLWAEYNSGKTVGQIMKLDTKRVYARAWALGLPRHSKRKRASQPARALWINAAKAEAAASDVRTKDILCGVRLHKVVRARWRAFRAVLQQDPNCSIYGLARLSGFDHTSILHGLARLEGLSWYEIKGAGKASGRRPAGYALGAAE